MSPDKYNELCARIDSLQEQIDALRAELSGEPVEDREIAAPLDISLDEDIVAPVEESVAEESVAEESVAEEPVAEEPVVEEPVEEIASPEVEEPVAEEPEEAPAVREERAPSALDMYSQYRWMTDMPGSPVSNIISGISLNDRVLLIKTVFQGDPMLFQKTVTDLNSMCGLGEAVSYLLENFPELKLGSDTVYRLMMAVRRKLS